MSKFIQNNKGLLVPKEEEKEEQPVKKEYPVKKGWNFSLCGPIYYNSQKEEFQKNTLQNLYAIVSRHGGIQVNNLNHDKCQDLVDQLAVEIIGGIPDEVEEYT